MRNRREAARQLAGAARGEDKGVAAGQDHFADRGIRGEIG